MKTHDVLKNMMIFALILLCGMMSAQDAERGRSKLPPPDFADVPYGPHDRNKLDVWLAGTKKPAPVLIYFHGGGFAAGSKANLPAQVLTVAKRAGITVVAANYRLSPGVVFPIHYLDCARAVQFTRHMAAKWNIDSRRVALTGSSAGGGTSLWIAFHDDLADLKSDDPVARESTRVTCAAVIAAQPTYDPLVVAKIAGESAARHRALTGMHGLTPEEANTEKARKLHEAAAAVTYLTPDDPPVFAYYGDVGPLPPAGARAGEGIHHLNFGIYLKEKMDAVNVECVLMRRGDSGSVTGNEFEFLKRQFEKPVPPKP
jgi:acetyl esterase/lipase